jgi:parallel beta-helix repeat protein
LESKWDSHGTSGTNHTLTTNNVTGNDVGIYIRESSICDITNNEVIDNNWGIWIRQAPFNDFTGNNISLNTLGIRVRAAEDNNITSNDMFGNTDYGIYITSASYRNWIASNTITDSELGVFFVRYNQWRPSNNFVVDNIISDCEAGIYLSAVLSNNLSANTMTNCGIFIDGDQLEFWNEHFIDTANTVNGKPVYYWKDQTGGTVLGDAGEVILANCTNVNLQSAETTWGTVGIELGFSNLVTLTLNNASFNNWYGIYLYASNGNTIWGNTASYNTRSGIHLGFSESNILTSNIMALDGIWIEGWNMNYWNTHDIDTANEVNGKPVYYWKDQTGGSVPSDAGEVILANCTNVIVSDTNPDWGTVGVLIGFSNDNVIDNNNLSNNRYGLYLTNSDGNTILNNTVSYNTDYGIQLQVCDNNLIYHNNIIGNTDQADDDQPGNFWNEAYSISGNYWSDYVGNDTFNGPLQDLLGPDGVGDTPHGLGNGRFDNYPLIDPWDPVRTPPSEPLSLVAVAGKIYVNLTWSPPASDGGYPVYTYHVYRGLFAGGETFYMDAGNTLTFNDTSVTAGENYFYVIVAVNILGEGSQSNRESAMPFSEPSEPLGLMTDSGNSYVNLTWNPPANDGGYAITNYTIYRGEASGFPTYIVEIGDVTYFNDTTAINGITYYYNITATNTIGEGPKSTEISDTPATVPSAPWSESVLEGDGFLNLTWNVPTDDGGSAITGYYVYRSDKPGEFETIPAGQLWHYDDDVTNGIQYDYTISAFNSEGEGPLSSVVSGIPKRPPFAVVSFQANVGDTEVNLTWEPPSNDGGSPVTGYKIYKGTESGNLSLIATIGDILYYKDIGVINGNTYYYVVTALNIVGEGSPSFEIDAIPATVPNEPTGLSAQAGDSYIELTWATPTDDGGSAITKYVIYKGTSSGVLTLLTEIDALETYMDTSVTNGVTYYYKVSAKNPAGEGPRSNEASGLPQRNPSIPLNLAIETGVSYVLLTWEAPASDGGAPITNYKIYRGESSGAETFLVEIADVLSYNDTDVTNGVEYFYKVIAVNDVGDSDFSNEVSGIPYEFPGAPLNMAIVSGDGFVAISWEAPTSEGSSSVTNYLIFRGDASETETFFKEIGNVLFYNDTSVTNGDTYYYYVIAKNSEGQGPHGDEVSATPKSVPGMATNLVAEEGNSYIDLSWDAPTSDGGSAITNYKIYRGTTSGLLTLLVEIGDVLTYNDTTAENGVTYYYVITGVNSVGEAPRTGEITATPFVDTDGDSTPDHLDTDDDDDGVPDTEEDKNGNGIVDPDETDPLNSDTDGDTYNDKEDAFPTNPDKWEADEPEEGFLIWILLLILIIVIVLVLFLATRKKGEPKEEIPTKEEDEGPEFEPTEEPEEGDMEKEEDLPAPDDEDLPPSEDMEPSEDEAPKDEITESEEPKDEVADSEESPSEDVEPKGDEPPGEDTEPPVEEEPAVDKKPENTESDSQEELDLIIEDLNNGDSSPDSEIKD